MTNGDILLVEDDKSIATVIMAALEDEAFRSPIARALKRATGSCPVTAMTRC